MAPTNTLRRAYLAAALGAVAALAACTGRTVEPSPEGLDQALRATSKAVAEAERAHRSAQSHAARGVWRSAARAVDRTMFALNDARRVRNAVAAIEEQARTANREAIRRRETADEQLAVMRRALATIADVVPRNRYASIGPNATCGVPCDHSNLAIARAAAHEARQAVDATAVIVVRSHKALSRIDRDVARIESIAREIRLVSRNGRALSEGPAPSLEIPFADPGFVAPPDTGFDQEVFGAQR